MANSNLSKSKQKEIKVLIETGRKQGYLTVSAINDLLPTNQYDPDQIEQITKLITDLKIKVLESAKEAEDSNLMNDEEVTDDDDSEITEDEAVEVLSSLDEEFGRTSDPVRMYMREMGTVELLNRAGEIIIAKNVQDKTQCCVIASECLHQRIVFPNLIRFKQSGSPFPKDFVKPTMIYPPSSVCCTE